MVYRVPPHMIERAVTEFRRGAWEESPPALQRARVITLSRQLGSGGRKVAETLGNWLRWPVWDREILEVISNQSRYRHSPRKFESLDERVQSSLDAFASSLAGDVDKHIYLHLLPKAIHVIARRDGVILGRGAHLLLSQALKVRIVASPETRVKNLIEYESLTPEEARKRIKTSDREREAFIRELAGRLGLRRSEAAREVEFDLVISTDGISIQQAASLVLAVARQKLGLGDAGGGMVRSGEPVAQR